MSKKTFLLPLLLSWVFSFAQTPSRPIHGKVTDEKGAPVPGATLRIKGSRGGNATDEQGTFSLNVHTGDQLIISSVNTTPVTIVIDERASYEVVLVRSAGTLDSVLVTTALGIRRT